MRTREVYPPQEIPHLWAHQSTRYARNSTGNVSLHGEVLYSYAEPIGRMMPINKRTGARVALFRDRTWSVTTSKHQHHMRCAVPNETFTVPDIGAGSGGYVTAPDHKANLKNYADKIIALAKTATRARSRRDWAINTLEAMVSEANRYKPKFTVPSDTGLEALKIKSQQEAKRDAAKRKALADARQKRNDEQYAKFINEYLPAWLAGGERIAFPSGRVEAYPASMTDYMRLVGEEIETSRGARVPIAHVRRALKLIAALPAGVEWHSNGHTIHVGEYSINSVSADGTVKVGCHTFSAAEVQRIAALLPQV
jgi:hypothetical protein